MSAIDFTHISKLIFLVAANKLIWTEMTAIKAFQATLFMKVKLGNCWWIVKDMNFLWHFIHLRFALIYLYQKSQFMKYFWRA